MPAKTKAIEETHWMPRQRSPTQQMMAELADRGVEQPAKRPKKPARA